MRVVIYEFCNTQLQLAPIAIVAIGEGYADVWTSGFHYDKTLSASTLSIISRPFFCPCVGDMPSCSRQYRGHSARFFSNRNGGNS